MTIERNLNISANKYMTGASSATVQLVFELTLEELELAFEEVQRMKDVDDIDLIFEGVFTNEQLNMLAKKKREIQDDEDGVGWREAVNLAIRQCGLWDQVVAYMRKA